MSDILDSRKWKEFKYSDIFDIERGYYNKRPEEYGDFKFISASRRNNGVTDRLDLSVVEKIYKGNCITVVNNGQSTSVAFYQKDDFTCSHDVNILRLKDHELDIYIAHFLLPILHKEKYRFNYGRKWRYERMEKTTIRLPVKSNGKPDWASMGNHTKTLLKEKIPGRIFTKLNESGLKKGTINLTNRKWKNFEYHELFELKKGERVVNDEVKEGPTPLIRPIEYNNGVHGYVELEPNHKEGTITINYNGSVGEAFYQRKPYFAVDDINILYPKFKSNSLIALFLITLIKQERYRFNYGRKWHLKRMKKSIIRLPVNDSGEPDWRFMEDYIKSLQLF